MFITNVCVVVCWFGDTGGFSPSVVKNCEKEGLLLFGFVFCKYLFVSIGLCSLV